MGDMADYTLECIERAELDRLDFHLGLIDELEAYDLGIIDELGYEETSTPRLITCKYCNKKDLQWINTDKGWRLSSDDEIHICKKYKK